MSLEEDKMTSQIRVTIPEYEKRNFLDEGATDYPFSVGKRPNQQVSLEQFLENFGTFADIASR